MLKEGGWWKRVWDEWVEEGGNSVKLSNHTRVKTLSDVSKIFCRFFHHRKEFLVFETTWLHLPDQAADEA